MPEVEGGTNQRSQAADDAARHDASLRAATADSRPVAAETTASTEPTDSAVNEDYAPATRALEDLTVSELISRWIRAPGPTWRSLLKAMSSPTAAAARSIQHSEITDAPPQAAGRGSAALASLSFLAGALRRVDTIQLILYSIAIAFAIVGSVVVRGSEGLPRANNVSLNAGAPYLWLGFLLWLAAEIAGNWTQLRDYWRGLGRNGRLRWAARVVPGAIWLSALFTLTASMTAPRESATELALVALGLFALGSLLWIVIEVAYGRVKWQTSTDDGGDATILERQPARRRITVEISHLRKLTIALAALSSIIVWTNTTSNRIEPPVILVWLLGVALWGFSFAPLRWNVFDWASDRIDDIRRLRCRAHLPMIIGFILVMLLGAAFRFNKLDAYPPQMFSDLVEKIQDAYKIHHFNDYRIFFDNIGGREPLHFYLLSILASQPGMEFNHYALKLMSALESFITLPIVFWLGVEVLGRRRRKFGLVVGLLAAGLVAVSFWHAVIGRQGLRVSLAPLFSALTAVYLVRALRHNRRSDYVKAGLALGFGLMGYQAARMLPLAAVAGVAVALVLVRRSWRTRVSYLLNLAVLAFVALMVFLPLFHYWTFEPESYMQRTSTRIFGDRPMTNEERAEFLLDSIPALMRNIRKTALIYHFHGDSTWVSAVPHEPAMDPVTAAFMLLGIAAWLALIVKMRDAVVVFVPIWLFATLLPTTLALSFPIEVPSFIRASGAIPPSYLIAALPVAVFCLRLCKTVSGRSGALAAVFFALGVLLAANHYNSSLYFGEFTDNYRRASVPHAQAGKILEGFAESDGAYGNAFVLTIPHWWDVRAVGIEADLMFWDSGGEVSRLPLLLERGLSREERYRLDPERDLLFFFSRRDEAAPALLSAWFPGGRQLEIAVQPAHKSFFVYRAPALGIDGLQRFIDENR